MSNNVLYDNNIKALKDYFPDIYSLVSDNNDLKEQDIEVSVEYIEDKPKLLVNTNDHIYRLDTLYDSNSFLDIWRKGFATDNLIEGKILMFGFGNGMFARKILNTVPKDFRLIVQEPSVKLFVTAMQYFDLTDIFSDKRLVLFVNPDMEKIRNEHTFVKYLSFSDIYNSIRLFYPGYEVIFPKHYSEYIEELQRTGMGIEANQTLYANCGLECNENTFANAKSFIYSKSLDDVAKGMPKEFAAIVVAGGPSLDKNIKDLQAAKGKALIIATDTALRPIYRAGIVPDIAISADALKGEKYFSEPDSRKVPLVCGFHVGYKAMAVHEGIKMFDNNYKPYIQEYLDAHDLMLPALLSGGSVANDALSLAYYLGARTIILIGQDLAYTDDKTHSEATVEGETQAETADFRFENQDIDIYGNPIRSSYQFKLYKEWIEAQIQIRDDLRVIDATEGGVLIRGTEIMTLKQAIERECRCDFDYESAVKKTSDMLDLQQRNDFTAHMANLPNKLREIDEKAAYAIKNYRDMIKLVEKNAHHSGKMVDLSNKVKKTQDEIESITAMEFVKNRTQGEDNETLVNINKTEGNERSELIAVCNIGIKSLTTMRRAVADVLPQAEQCAKELKSLQV